MVIFFSQLSSTHPIPRRSSSCRSIIALFIQSEVHRKQDLVKLFQHEGKVLRFKAKFAKPKPEVSPHKSAAFLTHWNQWIRHLLNFSDGCITWWLPSPIIWKYNLQSPHKWSQRCVKSPNFFRCLRCFFFWWEGWLLFWRSKDADRMFVMSFYLQDAACRLFVNQLDRRTG